MVQQLLEEDRSQVNYWKEKLLDALGDNGQIILDIIPEIEFIIGKQPVVSPLGLTESQNRFNLLFQNFSSVFARKEHPLVLFIDDLQWVDLASLHLIQQLLCHSDSQSFWLIVACRENEIETTHPLRLTLNHLQTQGIPIETITLQPLTRTPIERLIRDMFKCSIKRSRPLAELVLNKTAGNPFFIRMLLNFLHEKNFLYFNFYTQTWQWDFQSLQTLNIADNILNFVYTKINDLSEDTKNLLKLAACIGNEFELETLSIITEKSFAETALNLKDAIKAGLVLPLTDTCNKESTGEISDHPLSSSPVTYQFLHDQVQQGAYALIPENQISKVHYKIGKLLLKKTPPESLEEKVFEIVNQFNRGVELVSDRAVKDELARLNLIAGRKAKASVAYDSALRYLTTGLTLLTANSWQSKGQLTLALHVESAEVNFLMTNFEVANALAEEVLQKATEILNKVKAYELILKIDIARNQPLKAIERGMEALRRLGVDITSEYCDHQWDLSLPKLTELENSPEMTDPYQLAALRLLIAICPAAYFARPEILLSIVWTMIELCLKHGYSALSAYVYVWYAAILCGVTRDIEAGYHAGQLALKLLECYHAREFKANIYNLLYVLVAHWKDHARESVLRFQEGVQFGLDAGDIEYASYCIKDYCVHLFLIGKPLEYVKDEMDNSLKRLKVFKQKYSICQTEIWYWLIIKLTNKLFSGENFIDQKVNEVNVLFDSNLENCTLLFVFFLSKLILFYLFRNYDKAIVNANLALEHTEAVMGFMYVAVHNFYSSLALLAWCHTLEKNQKTYLLSQVESNQERMQHWAEHASMNYQHKYDLVEAEKAWVLGKPLEAMEYYDRAIQGAKKWEYLQDEALAYERAAEFYLSIGREIIAQTYLLEARYKYTCWEAIAKVEDLESRYPQLLDTPLDRRGKTLIVSPNQHSSVASQLSTLDLTTVIKTSQVIASEIILSKLLKKLMEIAIENAGAQTGYLILKKESELQIKVRSTVDRDELISCESIKITSDSLPLSVLSHVETTKEDVVLNDFTCLGKFTTDPYIVRKRPESLLCMPIIYHGQVIGLLYLENSLTAGAFTPNRLEILKLLSSQAAISIENAKLYEEMIELNRNLQQEIRKRVFANWALQENQQKLQDVLDNSPIVVYIKDNQGRYLLINQKYEKLFHIAKEKLIDKTDEVIFPPEVTEALRINDQQVFTTGNSLEFEEVIPQEDGDHVYRSLKFPLYNSTGKIYGICGISTDITEQKRAELERIKFARELEEKNVAL